MFGLRAVALLRRQSRFVGLSRPWRPRYRHPHHLPAGAFGHGLEFTALVVRGLAVRADAQIAADTLHGGSPVNSRQHRPQATTALQAARLDGAAKGLDGPRTPTENRTRGVGDGALRPRSPKAAKRRPGRSKSPRSSCANRRAPRSSPRRPSSQPTKPRSPGWNSNAYGLGNRFVGNHGGPPQDFALL
jgi:hypothetical protein